MEGVLLSLAVLACPIGMGLMMFFMMRSHGDKPRAVATPEELRAEHARISEELERHEQSEPVSAGKP